MKELTERIIHYAVLICVTIFAVGVMWKLSAKRQLSEEHQRVAVRALPEVAAAKAPVVVESLHVQTCEIFSTYAGKIRPWETFQVGFEVSGRVIALGENDSGEFLDDGDRVSAGQVLAVIDDRVFRAQKSEASARIEQATSDLQRAETVRERNPAALSESELQRLVTDLALARAQFEVAVKNLEDATLRAPVDATISRRLVNPGESVSQHQITFKLVQKDDVLLVVDVPESHIRELEERMRLVQQNLSDNRPNVDEEDRVVRAHVRLEGRDRFGKYWPELVGEVYQIAEVSDARTGLFEVEVRLSNSEQLLRPGMVATADLVTARIPGYRIPETAIISRQRKAHLFTVDREPTQMELLYWNLGPTDLFRARQVNLTQWVDQGSHVVVPVGDLRLDSVIVRGQFRLADSQVVRVTNFPWLSPGEMQTKESSRRFDLATIRSEDEK